MTSAPTEPLDVPPYELRNLISGVFGTPTVQVRCAQALGPEVYIGCSNGELLRYALQGNDPKSLNSYTLLSRQSLPADKPIDDIVLLPSISRAMILCDSQIHFYSLPALDPVGIKPIRNAVTLAVDEQALRRPPPGPMDPPQSVLSVEFCVIKRSAIAMYSLKDKLFYHKEIPFQSGGLYGKRTGIYLCLADKEYYNMVNLEIASNLPVLPVCQGDTPDPVKPLIAVISDNEFLILSWTGASTIGVFITGEGDPVRGTLEWPSHPQAVCLDYPYITTLLPNNTVEIHSVDTQSIVQVIPAPATSTTAHAADCKLLLASTPGFLVPSAQNSEKLRPTPVKLVRRKADAQQDQQGELPKVEDPPASYM